MNSFKEVCGEKWEQLLAGSLYDLFQLNVWLITNLDSSIERNCYNIKFKYHFGFVFLKSWVISMTCIQIWWNILTNMTCAKMAIPTPPLGDLTYKSRKIKWSLPDLLEAWNMAIEQVRPAPRKKGKVHFS